MKYSITVAALSLIPDHERRLLVGEPRAVATFRDARAWMARLRPTWLADGVLSPTECGFIGVVLDDEGIPALTIEYGLDLDAEPVEHNRSELAAMRGAE